MTIKHIHKWEYSLGNPTIGQCSRCGEWEDKMTYEELKKKQVGGSHYKKLDPQPWDFYRGFMSREMWKGYLLGNIIDYLVRDKNGLEDLKKAQHLLDVLVATEEEVAIPEEMLRATSGRGPGVDKRTGPTERRKCWQHPIPDGKSKRMSKKRGRRADDISYQEWC